MTWPWQDRLGNVSFAKIAALVIAILPGASMLYDTAAGNYGPMPVHGLLYWSGVWATALLLLALAVTPLRHVLRWNRVIAVRRIIGLSALAYTLFHVLTYFALDSWDFELILSEMAVLSPNVIAATASTIGMIALGATSFDAAVRRMGARRWQRLHRTIYLLAVLAIAHFLLSRGIFAVQYLTAGMLFWLLGWRILKRGADPVGLAFLAIVSALFTATLEAAWMWVHHEADPWTLLGENFSLDGDLSPAGQVLGLGLLIAAAARISDRAAGGANPDHAVQESH